MLKTLRFVFSRFLGVVGVIGLIAMLFLVLRTNRIIQKSQSQSNDTSLPVSTAISRIPDSLFVSPVRATPTINPDETPWNWQPTATALTQMTPKALPVLTATPFGGPTTPTPAKDMPLPTMIPPKSFRAEDLKVADVRFVDFDGAYEFIAWSPDGTYILVEPHNSKHWRTHPRIQGKQTWLFGLWMMRPDGTEAKQIAEWAAGSVAWSPDGKHIAYSTPIKEEGADAEIRIIDTKTLQSWMVAKTNQFIGWQDIYWLSDNELTFLNDGNIFAVHIEKKDIRQLNDIYIKPEKSEERTPGHYKVSPDGQKIAWIPGENTKELWIANIDGSKKTLVSDQVSRRGADRAIAWSPDSNRLAFTVFNNQGPTGSDLWVADADGSNPQSVVTTKRERESLRQPIWSPDGQVIVFVRGTSQMDSYLWIVNRNGTGLKSLGEDQTGVVNYPLWSPTGTQIAYNRELWEPSGLPNTSIITLK